MTGFSEGPATFTPQKDEMRAAHGGTGMHLLIEMACIDETGYGATEAVPGPFQAVFGRLHDAVKVPEADQEDYRNRLKALAADMEDNGGGDGPATAGMTFLGQFIDHDLTLDATTELGHAAGDLGKIRNFRTPRLDLDCVYGGGPEVSPHLFDQRPDHAGAMLFGRGPYGSHNDLDLPRNRQGRALIGDPRNDENIFVSQVHGRCFIAEHNCFADHYRQSLTDGKMIYRAAREALTKQYHAQIVDEFLPSTVDATVLQPFMDWLKGGAPAETGAINWMSIPDMPVEFSAAAYRFGHSMVRQRYKLNDQVSADIFGSDLTGFVPVDEKNNLDLGLFFGEGAQPSRPIDTKIPNPLINLPPEVVGNGEKNLAFRNMDRGQLTFALPTGEMMADFLGFAPIATHPLADKHGFGGAAPLWFYILAEGEAHGGKLGPVGGSIVAGVLTRLLILGKSPMADALVA